MWLPLCFKPSIELDVALPVRPENGQILHFLAKNLLGKVWVMERRIEDGIQ